jgi:MFS family permease
VRPVARLLAAYACASLATGLPWPLLLVLVWDRYGEGPHGAWAVGLAGAARMAPYVLLSWAAGSLGDHVRRDLLVRATIALRLLFLGLGAAALAADRVDGAVVAVGLAVLCGTPTYPAIAASLPGLAGDRRALTTELLVTIEVSAWVVGPALGGLLLAQSLRAWTLPLAIALAAVGLALSTGVAIPGPVERASDSVRGMLRTVTRCRAALGALALAGLVNLVVTVTGMSLLPLSEDGWHHGDAGFGLATACLGFGALAAPVLARFAVATIARGMGTVAVAVALVAATPVPWPALPLLALAGASGVVVESRVTGTLQDAVPDRYRAGALGVADTVMVGACLLGSLVAPALADSAGARAALLVVAAVALLPLAGQLRLVATPSPSTRTVFFDVETIRTLPDSGPANGFSTTSTEPALAPLSFTLPTSLCPTNTLSLPDFGLVPTTSASARAPEIL